MIVRVDALGILLEAQRVLALEVLGGFFGQASLGRWWLPCAALSEGESPSELAMRTVEVQVGLKLADPVVVGARPQKVGNDWHLGLVIAGALGGTPGPLTRASPCVPWRCCRTRWACGTVTTWPSSRRATIVCGTEPNQGRSKCPLHSPSFSARCRSRSGIGRPISHFPAPMAGR